MKIARFEDKKGKICYGIIDPSTSLRVNPEHSRRIDSRTPKKAELIEGDIFGKFRQTGRSADIARLLAPVDPPNIIAIGLNYRDHAGESSMKIPQVPLIFLKATTSVIGPDEPILLPKAAPAEVDYEAELVIIIGKLCHDIEPEQVDSYILGYTCGNDVSARDCQWKIDSQWARAKSFDTFCPLGPWVVTTDELNPSNLAIKAILSGQVMQDSNTSLLIFPVPQLVSFLSKQLTLLPGTVIMTGTPPGVGFVRKPPVFIKSGDEIIIEIEGVGRLRNPVK